MLAALLPVDKVVDDHHPEHRMVANTGKDGILRQPFPLDVPGDQVALLEGLQKHLLHRVQQVPRREGVTRQRSGADQAEVESTGPLRSAARWSQPRVGAPTLSHSSILRPPPAPRGFLPMPPPVMITRGGTEAELSYGAHLGHKRVDRRGEGDPREAPEVGGETPEVLGLELKVHLRGGAGVQHGSSPR